MQHYFSQQHQRLRQQPIISITSVNNEDSMLGINEELSGNNGGGCGGVLTQHPHNPTIGQQLLPPPPLSHEIHHHHQHQHVIHTHGPVLVDMNTELPPDMYGVCPTTNMNGQDYNNTSGSDVELGDPSVCAGCSGNIEDRYFLVAVEKQWHVSCLRCSECHIPLESELTCFSKDGHVYCKEDYYRKFAVRACSRCHLPISSQELVMRARDLVYHVTCFACASCNTVLNTGEQFGMRDSLIFCKHHYEVSSPVEFPHQPPPQGGVIGPGDLGSPISQGYSFPGVSPPSKGRPRKRKNQSHIQEHDVFTGLMPDEIGPDGYPLSNSARQKRIRTSFKHHQLRILKSYFALNQNPDAKDLKQLSQKTGLTKRVLQVWFQNARAKYRRNLLKDSNGNINGKDSTEEGSPKSPSDNTQNSFSSELNDEGSRSSEHMGDIGSPTNIMDLQGGFDHDDSHNNMMHLSMTQNPPLSELYNTTVNAMN